MNSKPGKENKMMMEMHEMIDIINVQPMPGNPDHHFAMMMKMHQEGAVHMAAIELKEGSNSHLKKMAQLIVQKQKLEIAQLKGFLSTHNIGAVNHDFNTKMEACMDNMNEQSHRQYINGNIDHDFAVLMIPHHRCAVEMACLIIQNGHNELIQRLAREIIEDREPEMEAFTKWLAIGSSTNG